jgi:hypothetical protein
MSSPVWFSIPEFTGIQQHKDGRLLPISSAYDARNIDTSDGNLNVAKGFSKWTTAGNAYKVPGSDAIRKLIIAPGEGNGNVYDFYAVTDTTIYGHAPSTGAWSVVHNDDTNAGFAFQYTLEASNVNTLSARIGSEDVILVCTRANNPIIVIKMSNGHVRKFGSGGSSNIPVSLATMYANRLFAAGNITAPVRLYWSSVPGDGRTIEDWTMVDGSEDASGGYVEVGDNTRDEIIGLTALSNQLIIWKRFSTWRLLGDRPSTFTLELIEKNVFGFRESPLQLRPLVFHDAPYFMRNDGLQTYDTTGIVPVDSGGSHLKRFLAGLTEEAFMYARNVLYRGRFYMSVKVGTRYAENMSNGYDNALVVFDTTTGAYMIRDGFEIGDIASDGRYIFLINGDRYIYKFEDGNTYNGTKIHAYWQTQPIDFGRKMYRHQLMGVYMQLTGGDVKINIDGDYAGSSKELVAKKDTTRKGYIAVRVQTDQSNEFSFTFDNKTGNSTYTNFAIKGGVNIKTLSELKE